MLCVDDTLPADAPETELGRGDYEICLSAVIAGNRDGCQDLLREVLEFFHRFIRVLAYNGKDTWKYAKGILCCYMILA